MTTTRDMETMAGIATQLVDELCGYSIHSDTASVTLDDGTVLRITKEIDEDWNIIENDEFYGQLEWTSARAERPHPFNGNAEKLPVHTSARSTALWWQPPQDVKRTDDTFWKLRRRVIDIVNGDIYAMGVVVTARTPCGACGGHSQEKTASIWGVESDTDNLYLADLVQDLLTEVL